MKRELDQKLCADYPEIFRDRHADMRTTALCWGFECGDGWYPIIDELCDSLMTEVKHLRSNVENIKQRLEDPDKSKWSDWMKVSYTPENLVIKQAELAAAESRIPVATQVKEKFGTLSFYVDRASDSQRAYIGFAQRMSSRICEECGVTKDTMLYTFGWYKTLCPEHARETYGDEADDFRNKTGTWAPDAV